MTQTLTAPVETRPLEPTTPIRPSEAIRLGCLIAPVEAYGDWGGGNAACVNRALVLGLWGAGSNEDIGTSYGAVNHTIGRQVEPPCGSDCPDALLFGVPGDPASDVLIHLNDDHRWPRERIADWLGEQGL